MKKTVKSTKTTHTAAKTAGKVTEKAAEKVTEKAAELKETAQKAAEKMACVAKEHQVLCITHLPQIAAMADAHYGISKEVSDGGAITNIEQLSEDESVKELARLIGGAEITENTLKSAQEMKEMCRQFKDLGI